MIIRCLFLSLAIWAGLMVIAFADDDQKAADRAEWWRGTVTLQVENDMFAGTDRHYTHGTRLGWVSHKQNNETFDWAKQVLKPFYLWGKIDSGRVGFAIGQNIYTPENIETTAYVPGDRPYAGWLYGEVAAYIHSKGELLGHDIDALDSLALNFGVVGPSAFGGDAQNLVHDIRNIPRANGWDHQLKDEPALNIMMERKWRPASWKIGPVEWDTIPFVGGSLGNVFTLANGGVMFRLGQNLEEDFGPPHIRPSFSGVGAVDRQGFYSWYFFAGAEGRYVARNIFLDGNSFRDSHSVDKKPFVGDFQVGVAGRLGMLTVAYTQIFRTKEFYGQDKPDRYGVISLGVDF